MLLFICLILACAFSSPLPDPALANQTILLAFSAYCGNAVNGFSCYWCKKLSSPFQVVGTFGDASGPDFGFVGVLSSQYVVISWRGTDNIGGFIGDAQFEQTQFPLAPSGARCHAGFLKMVLSNKDAVARLVSKALSACSSCSLLWTGHSLGASMSTLNALLYQNDTQARVESQILNFGSPRIFNPAGADWLPGALQKFNITSHIRVTSTRDPVPHLPPQNFIEHYRHSATEVYETSNVPLVFRACSGGEDPNCADSVAAWQMNVLDHAHYMGLNILDGVPRGCLYTDSKKK